MLTTIDRRIMIRYGRFNDAAARANAGASECALVCTSCSFLYAHVGPCTEECARPFTCTTCSHGTASFDIPILDVLDGTA